MLWISSVMSSLNEKYGPDRLRSAFYLAQIVMGLLFVGALLRLKARSRVGSDSGFAVRESDLRKPKAASATLPAGSSKNDLANAKLERKVPLALEGIRIDGPPHEVLGVAVGASEEVIQKAYRERMKRYHPDKVGRPGSREWQDAQKLAEAINAAKNELLKRLRNRG
jgi:hypothetical protein